MSNNQIKNVCSYAMVTGKNAKPVDALITEAISSAKTMKEKVQVAGVAILIHAEKCGDYRKANDLVHGLGNGVNSTALVEWFKEYGGFTVSEEAQEFDGWSGAEHIRERFQDAKCKAWYDLKPQNPWAGINGITELEKLLAKIEKAEERLAKAVQAEDQEAIAELTGKIEVSDVVKTGIVTLIAQAKAA